jgi:hypothetical protein
MINTLSIIFKIIIGAFFTAVAIIAFWTATYSVAILLTLMVIAGAILEYLDKREKTKKPVCYLYTPESKKCLECCEVQNLMRTK